MAAPSTKSCEATEAPQTGWSLTSLVFTAHSETDVVNDHPGRSISERDHVIIGTATPPLQEGNLALKESVP